MVPMKAGPGAEDRGTERSSMDEVLAVYRVGVDRTLLRENLRLDPEARSRRFEAFMKSIEEIRGAARRTPR